MLDNKTISMKTFIKRFLIFLLLIFVSCSEKSNEVNEQIKPYVDFLKTENRTSKDYILKKFENDDLIIICERFHPEFTQYEFILELCKDERFIQNIGNIFIEVSTRNFQSKVNTFIKDKSLSESDLDSLLKNILRNKSVHPISINTNFPFLLKGLRQVNKDLSSENKLNLFSSDVSIDWADMINSNNYKEFWYNTIVKRDSLMADYIIEKFDSIQNSSSKRQKALVIMNYRHAFGNEFMMPENEKPDNVGRYLFAKYPKNISNVLINSLTFSEVRSDNDADVIAIQDGKWDAAFKKLQKDNLGFDFKDSPFGNDYFELWPFTEHKFSYSQVFNGFIYYTPIEEIKLVSGVSNIIDSTFLVELKRRNSLVNKARNVNFSTNDSTLWKYNQERVNDKFITDSIKIQINKWLK